MKAVIYIFLAGGMVAATLLSGCAGPVYTVVDELPDPPATAGDVPITDADQARPLPSPPPPQSRPRPQTSAVGAEAGEIPQAWIPKVREQPWRYIVVHHSATATGNAVEFDRLHREERGWDELGYHFVITNGHGAADGLVEIGPRWSKQKWGAHTGGTVDNEYNDYGIGICLVGDFDKGRPSEAQLASLRKLVDFLSQRYAIPATGVIGHNQAPLAATACPGEWLSAYLAETYGTKPHKTISRTTHPAGPPSRPDFGPAPSGS